MNAGLYSKTRAWVLRFVIQLQRLFGGSTLTRNDYKTVWNKLSENELEAKMAVSGFLEEETYHHTAEATKHVLEASVKIRPEDEILEIGCGVGRVGAILAPICKMWIGCDVSGNMLTHAAKRLVALTNVRLVEISGFGLDPIPNESLDLVYCTVVFMHLEEWERYRYLTEAYRVLRPGGRIFIDNFTLTTDEGWAVFEESLSFPADARPVHISKSSTPQEFQVFLERAGFHDVLVEESERWVRGWGKKIKK